jgi:serine/threonine-protein kinase
MVGRTISHYQITQRLGGGGMGEIYRALDMRLNRRVAIKVLAAEHAGTGEQRRRFLQEAQAASALNHPNIITIHDVVSEGETEFIVMELVDGKTLAELIPNEGLPLPLVLAYAVQVADALEAAHRAGIVHRDLKPGNVMVTDAGLVKVLDFGLAKVISETGALLEDTRTLAHAPLTAEGRIMGTVAYMSPEQAEGKPVDARSDIFAFGAMLHEMVTGERAFGGDSAISILSSILRDEVRPLTRTAGVPSVLENIALRCLRKNREERWQSMHEVGAALAALKRDSDSGALLAPLPPPAVPAVRNKSRLPLAAALLGLVAMAGVASWWAIGRRTPAVVSPPSQPVAAAPTVPLKTADNGILTNDAVLEMVRARVPAKLIEEQIRSSATRFDLSTSEIIRLTQANVPADVIETMRDPKRTAAAAPPAGAQKTVAAPAAAAPASPTRVAATPVATPGVQTVLVSDGMPVAIRLEEDVPADAPAGRALRFSVARELRAGDTVVLAQGAAVTGEIVEAAHKKLIGGNRIMFRLRDADTVGGGKLDLRALPRHAQDSRQSIESAGGGRRRRDLAAAAGAEYAAYVEGDQTVAVR